MTSFKKRERNRPGGRNQTTQQGQEHTTGPDPHTEPEKKARGQGRPHTQDTRRHAPGNGRTDEPENQVAFPTFRFDLRGGTLAVLQPCRVSLFTFLASATVRNQREREPHWIPIQCVRHVVTRTHLVPVVRPETEMSLTYKAETDLHNASVSRPTRRSSSRTGHAYSTSAKSSIECTPPV